MLEHSKGAVVLTMEQSTDVTSNQQERLVDTAWLAGNWESDGCFGIFNGGKNRLYAQANFPNTDQELIEAIHAVLERLSIGHYIVTRRLSQKNSNHSDSKTIMIVGFKRVKKMLDVVQPFLRGEKRKVAEVVRRFVERRLSVQRGSPYSKQDYLDQATVRALNKKGTTRILRDYTLDASGEDIVQAA